MLVCTTHTYYQSKNALQSTIVRIESDRIERSISEGRTKRGRTIDGGGTVGVYERIVHKYDGKTTAQNGEIKTESLIDFWCKNIIKCIYSMPFKLCINTL